MLTVKLWASDFKQNMTFFYRTNGFKVLINLKTTFWIAKFNFPLIQLSVKLICWTILLGLVKLISPYHYAIFLDIVLLMKMSHKLSYLLR